MTDAEQIAALREEVEQLRGENKLIRAGAAGYEADLEATRKELEAAVGLLREVAPWPMGIVGERATAWLSDFDRRHQGETP